MQRNNARSWRRRQLIRACLTSGKAVGTDARREMLRFSLWAATRPLGSRPSTRFWKGTRKHAAAGRGGKRRRNRHSRSSHWKKRVQCARRRSVTLFRLLSCHPPSNFRGLSPDDPVGIRHSVARFGLRASSISYRAARNPSRYLTTSTSCAYELHSQGKRTPFPSLNGRSAELLFLIAARGIPCAERRYTSKVRGQRFCVIARSVLLAKLTAWSCAIVSAPNPTCSDSRRISAAKHAVSGTARTR